MNLLTTILLFFVFCVKVNGQQDQCTAANGRQGQCISLNDCESLLAIINKPYRSPQDVDFLRKSYCGFYIYGWPAVCCPGQASTTISATSSQCFTPEGELGECIGIYSCPHLINLLKPPVPNETIEYLKRSRCTNSPDEYGVCCGTVKSGAEQNVEKNCASVKSAFPPDPKTGCCGVDTTVANKLVGGTSSSVDEHPWLAVIEYNKDALKVKVQCSGVLISSRYVLTAAHCVIGEVLKLGTPTNIILGEYDTSNEGPDCTPVPGGGQDCTEGVTRIAIEKTIPHPQYEPKNRQRRNDIALIRIAETAPYTDFIRPICLPREDISLKPTAYNLTAAGWGSVNIDQKGYTATSVKSKVLLPFIKQTECQQAYRAPKRNVTLWKGQICAGGMQGKDSCKGDSGGPLMHEKSNIQEAVGIVSFGPLPCGIEGVPGVYTNVYEYNSWIRSNIVP